MDLRTVRAQKTTASMICRLTMRVKLAVLSSPFEKKLSGLGSVISLGVVVDEMRRDIDEHGSRIILTKYADYVHALLPAIRLSLMDSSDNIPLETIISRMFNIMLHGTPILRERLKTFDTIEHLVDRLQSAQDVIILCGAGISTSVGIPDFRSDTGLYSMLFELGISEPQEVFDINVFREDPSIFYSIAKKILPSIGSYSPTHAFFRLLQDKGKLRRVYTQNIDGLERQAGIDEEKLVECHGSFSTAACFTCNKIYSGHSIREDILSSKIPECSECMKYYDKKGKKRLRDEDEEIDSHSPVYGVIKPNITFFGEKVSSRFEEHLLGGDYTTCDLLLCVGTSLKVSPVAELIGKLPESTPHVLISKTPITHVQFDINVFGPCDAIITDLCQRTDWELMHEMIPGGRSTSPESRASGRLSKIGEHTYEWV